jgi:hypothetical protein
MNHDTAALIQALGSINQHIPRMANDVLLGHMPPAKQHEFADLLIELGGLLHCSADAEDAEEAEDAPPAGDPAAQLTDSEEPPL